MASAPSASWNSRCMTHLANCPNRSLPTNTTDESKGKSHCRGEESNFIPHFDGVELRFAICPVSDSPFSGLAVFAHEIRACGRRHTPVPGHYARNPGY